MKLAHYFMAPHTIQALDRYVAVVPLTCSVAHRLDLYRSAQTVFASALPDNEKQEAFHPVYDNLKSRWQVFRPKSSQDCWGSDQIYTALSSDCQQCSRQSGVTLATLTEQSSGTDIAQCLESLGRIKPTAQYPAVYPWMAVAKFSHFFNPHLFPIYDTAFIWDKVANGAFKPDYLDFCRRRGFNPKEDTARFNLQYTLWAAEIVQGADEKCMKTFAEWFGLQSADTSSETNLSPDTESYFAAAFEMIAIGAAHL